MVIGYLNLQKLLSFLSKHVVGTDSKKFREQHKCKLGTGMSMIITIMKFKQLKYCDNSIYHCLCPNQSYRMVFYKHILIRP